MSIYVVDCNVRHPAMPRNERRRNYVGNTSVKSSQTLWLDFRCFSNNLLSYETCFALLSNNFNSYIVPYICMSIHRLLQQGVLTLSPDTREKKKKQRPQITAVHTWWYLCDPVRGALQERPCRRGGGRPEQKRRGSCAALPPRRYLFPGQVQRCQWPDTSYVFQEKTALSPQLSGPQ